MAIFDLFGFSRFISPFCGPLISRQGQNLEGFVVYSAAAEVAKAAEEEIYLRIEIESSRIRLIITIYLRLTFCHRKIDVIIPHSIAVFIYYAYVCFFSQRLIILEVAGGGVIFMCVFITTER